MWKAVPEYEGLYEVSDSGEVRSVDKMIKCANWRIHKGQILKGTYNSKGYLRVQLTDRNGIKKKCFVHRIVALAFCEKPEGCDVVNHLDCNTTNNRADNLEWTTLRGNSQYAARLGRLSKTEEWKRKIIEGQKLKRVIGISLIDGTELYFSSVNETKKSGFQPSCVSNCCNGIRISHAGYVWRFA